MALFDLNDDQVVNVLYQENDWVYVIAEDQREGFIPHSYCAPYTPHLGEMTLTVKKKLPRDLGIPDGGDTNHNTTLNSTSKTTAHKADQGFFDTLQLGSFFPAGTLAIDGSDNESYAGTKSLIPTNSPQSLMSQQQQQPARHMQSSSTQSLNSQISHPDIHPFFKVLLPHLARRVVFTLVAHDRSSPANSIYNLYQFNLY